MPELHIDEEMETQVALQQIRDRKRCTGCNANIGNDYVDDSCPECGMSMAEMLNEISLRPIAQLGAQDPVAPDRERYDKEIDRMIASLEATMGLYDPVAAQATRGVH